jgi:hypothetical protein
MNKINQEPEYEKKPMKKTQREWIQYFNEKKEKMISAPDYYNAFNSKDNRLIESLKKDFKDYWEITSTQIHYNKDNLKATIIHDAESEVVTPKLIEVEVPVLSGTNFEKNESLEKYLQALFDTTDKLDIILEVLKSVDKEKHLWFYTLSQGSRNSNPVRAVRLYFDDSGFVVLGDGWTDGGNGGSRGARSINQKPKASAKTKVKP